MAASKRNQKRKADQKARREKARREREAVASHPPLHQRDDRYGCLDADFWQAPNERFLGRLFANVVGAGSSQVSRGEAISGLS